MDLVREDWEWCVFDAVLVLRCHHKTRLVSCGTENLCAECAPRFDEARRLATLPECDRPDWYRALVKAVG